MISWTWYDLMNMIWFDEHDMISWPWYDFMTEFMTMIYLHDRKMLWWTWFNFMTMIWFDEHDMIWCKWYDFMTMIWFRDRIHDHDLLSWPWNALMNMIWFHDHDMICWPWYDFITMIWCHDHDMATITGLLVGGHVLISDKFINGALPLLWFKSFSQWWMMSCPLQMARVFTEEKPAMESCSYHH